MSITKRDRERLERILSRLERGLAYMDKPSTFLAVRAHPASGMTFQRTVTAGQIEHCMRGDDPLAVEGLQAIAVVDKFIGSEFTLIRNARRELAQFLAPVEQESYHD